MTADSVFDRESRIRNSSLSMGQKFYLITVNRFIGNNPDAWPSQQTIAKEMSASPRAVRKWQSELKGMGVLQVAVRKGRSHTNRYRLNLEKLPRNEERRAAFQNDSEIKEEPRASVVRNHMPLNEEPSAYRKNKKEQLKEQGGNLPISRARSTMSSKGKTDSELTEFCVEWNAWYSDELVCEKIENIESPGATITDAWRRSRRDREQRKRLQDFQSLRTAIEGSQQMLKPARWFDAAGLIGGKNSNGRWYAEQLRRGIYRDRSENSVSGSREAEQAWQAVQVAVQEHSHYRPNEIRQDVGERAWKALESIGLKRVDQATEFERNELKAKFIDFFDRQEVAT